MFVKQVHKCFVSQGDMTSIMKWYIICSSICSLALQLEQMMGMGTRYLRIDWFAQKQANPSKTSKFPFSLSKLMAVVQAYPSQDPPLLQLPLLLWACSSSPCMDTLHVTWMIQSCNLLSHFQPSAKCKIVRRS
jgi:hypothetical protein